MLDPEALKRENDIVLSTVQVLMRRISSDVTAVAVLVEAQRVELTFWADRLTDEIDEDADDATFELDALLDDYDHPLIEYRVRLGRPDPKRLASYGRMIYWSKCQTVAGPTEPRSNQCPVG
ncbi:hypothetical protein FHS29_005124 [Saccharothrix tamanrassetensis]|uniref:Uncharacterized protein n=1 Tax=Saccharothrix tamanrassetensis TaxID=1051531 RepID=A0A841CSV7_9PSEU|nr:hypothetical protein [Saccharothrix tamanrassetensis]MBB5958516.1 hypothetical protein [Saccharothrix tamanrassetensis]